MHENTSTPRTGSRTDDRPVGRPVDRPVDRPVGRRILTRRRLGALAAIGVLPLAGCGLRPATAYTPDVAPGKITRIDDLPKGARITVTGKNFTEQLILGKIGVIAARAAGFEVDDLTNVPGSVPVRELMTNGGADMTWEYTGTAWLTYLGEAKGIPDKKKQWKAVYDADLENGLTWLPPAPLNNTYALAVRSEAVDELGGITKLSQIEDLPVDDRTICVESEFNSRADGLVPLLKAYGIPRGKDDGVPAGNISLYDTGAVYTATEPGQLQLRRGLHDRRPHPEPRPEDPRGRPPLLPGVQRGPGAAHRDAREAPSARGRLRDGDARAHRRRPALAEPAGRRGRRAAGGRRLRLHGRGGPGVPALEPDGSIGSSGRVRLVARRFHGMSPRHLSSRARPRPEGLRVDLQHLPVGVPVRGARFSWTVPQLGDSMQRLHRIQVARTPRGFGGPLWDSGWVTSERSVAVPYEGPDLDPSTPYWWRVAVDTDAPGDWSSAQCFVTAADGWGGEGIWGPVAMDEWTAEDIPWVLLRTEFDLPAQPVRAAFIEAAGLSPEGGPTPQGPRGARQHVYKLWANAQVVGYGSVRSGFEEAMYHTHDLTAVLRPGRNALAALCWADAGRVFTARLVVVLADGTRLEVPTSTRWRARSGAMMLPSLKDLGGGWFRAPREDWDMRHEPRGWQSPGFDDSGWDMAARSGVELPPPMPATVSIRHHLGDVVHAHRAGGSAGGGEIWRADLGREIVGGIRLAVTGRAGARIRVRLGEELEVDGSVRSRLRTSNVYEETWTLRDGPQTIEHWGLRTFRHVELEADAGSGLDLSRALRPVVLRSPVVGGGEFSSSDPDLDRVWELCRYSIEATSQDLYVDTQSRERLPYEGDALVNQRSQYAVEPSFALARASLAFLTRRPTWPAEYHLMPPLMAWEDYLATGDDRRLREDLHFLEQGGYQHLLEDGLVRKDPGSASEWDADLVDWPQTSRDGFEFTEVNTVVNAFQATAFRALARIGEAIGDERVADTFGELAETATSALNSRLLAGGSDARDSGVAYVDGEGTDHRSQHASAIPVALGLAPAEHLPALGKHLASGGMRMSVYGAQFLLDALFTAGRSREAIALMTARTTESWLHQIDDLGATIVPEAWDPAQKPNMSFSHAWGTAPANVIARWVLGVRVTEPGAARVRIAPHPGGLARIRGAVPTIRGLVGLDLDRERGTLAVQVPPNTRAEIVLDRAELGIAGHPRIEAPGEWALGASEDEIVIDGVIAGRVSVTWQV
jgi:glycine betaine/choline ABC-type transport system substrate-binding protein